MTYHVPIGDSEDLKRVYVARCEYSLDDVLQHLLPTVVTTFMTGSQRVFLAQSLLHRDIWRPDDVLRVCDAVGCRGDSDTVWTRAAQNALDPNHEPGVGPKTIGLVTKVLRHAVNATVTRAHSTRGPMIPPHILLALLMSNPVIRDRRTMVQRLLDSYFVNGRIPASWAPRKAWEMSETERRLYLCNSHREALNTLVEAPHPPNQSPIMTLTRLAELSFSCSPVLGLGHLRKFYYTFRRSWGMVDEHQPYRIPSMLAHMYLRHVVWQLRKPLLPLYRALPPSKQNRERQLAVARRRMVEFADSIATAEHWFGSDETIQRYRLALYAYSGGSEQERRTLQTLKEMSPEYATREFDLGVPDYMMQWRTLPTLSSSTFVFGEDIAFPLRLPFDAMTGNSQ